MATETIIRLRSSIKALEGHHGTAPLEEGPSYVRFVCDVLVRCSSRRLGGEGQPVRRDDIKFTMETERKHVLDDDGGDPASVFLDYEETRRMAWAVFTGMRELRCIDLSRSNWVTLMPDDDAAAWIHRTVKRNHDEGLAGGHYRFRVRIKLKVELVFSEPEALVGKLVWAETRSGDTCGICLDGLMTSKRCKTPPANLPCGHAFHPPCITKWLFKGTTCPICRDDLTGLAAAPWESGWMSCPGCIKASTPCDEDCPSVKGMLGLSLS
uniref:RING-type domain-containing protein n=1 Tax=Oryza punctata TaxID=4537 RepID=A0A0E0JJT8_ORYPU